MLLGWLFPNWCQHDETWLQTWHKQWKRLKKIDKWGINYHLLCLESRLLPLQCTNNKLTIFLCIIWATKHPKCCLFQSVHYWPVFYCTKNLQNSKSSHWNPNGLYMLFELWAYYHTCHPITGEIVLVTELILKRFFWTVLSKIYIYNK
jgi:hypothetical protein